MQLSQIMTRDVEVVPPDATLMEAAGIMRDLNVGSVPVCDGRRVLGILTDRDIVIRAAAEGRDPTLSLVRDYMTPDVMYCFEDQDVAAAAELMRDHQIRRLPILDRERNLVGIVALGDLAVDTQNEEMSGEVLEGISEPARPER